jgi:4-hydroxybenzoate polyprenyltransferase/phosphoserine phosphatase
MIPLVLDLDGTLVRGDTLAEGALRLLATRPLVLVRLLGQAIRDRALFKQSVASAARLDPASLVFNDAILAHARAARAEGREVVLATAADSEVAESVAAHLGLFDCVVASDGRANLKGAAKAAALVARFGQGGFDYAGDAGADIAVWAQARHAIVVDASPALLARARAANPSAQAMGVPASAGTTLRLLARALRLHQWAKNLLVFVPVLADHKLQAGALGQAAIGFVAFSLCASSVYLLNDLLDLPHDRAHAKKRHRPFASGALSVTWAPGLMGGLLGGALLACAFLPHAFLAMLAAYYASTCAYSFMLKRRAVWDVVTLAGLYTFSLFLFFCLAVVKRLTELTLFVRANGRASGPSGRGYAAEDLDMLRSMAASSGYMAVLVMALYVNSPTVLPLYRHPDFLWALCPILLFWVSRVLMISNRGLMNDDPVIFALRDRVSLLAGLASLAAILAAT